MPISSSPRRRPDKKRGRQRKPLVRPLIPMYRNEYALIEEHEMKLKRAASRWPGEPICPDCYRPLQQHWRGGRCR